MAVHDQVYSYLSDNDLLHPYHHGFLKHHSTATALQQLVDLWLRAADSGKLSASILLDLSAGFDVVNHSILLAKLNEYGFDETSLGWFESYLHDRVQCVQVESSFSPMLKVPWGVPQGSILGPLLFIIFINELPEVVKPDNEPEDGAVAVETEHDDASIVVYADDNTPTIAAKDPGVLIDNVQALGTRVTTWFGKNDMVVSGEKTKLLLSGTYQNRRLKIENNENFHPEINIDGKEILPSRSEKLLGVIVNDTLTWKNHFYGDEENTGLFNDLSKRAGLLRHLRKYLPNGKFKQAISGIFTSKLIYCITLWTGIWDIPGQLDDGNKL